MEIQLTGDGISQEIQEWPKLTMALGGSQPLLISLGANFQAAESEKYYSLFVKILKV